MDLLGSSKSRVCVNEYQAAGWKQQTSTIDFGHAAALIDNSFGYPV